jgi:hypothetical protein
MGRNKARSTKKPREQKVATFAPPTVRRIRRLVTQQLESQGFTLQRGEIVSLTDHSKEALRNLHLAARAEKANNELKALGKLESDLLTSFADGDDIDPEKIEPQVTLVHADTPESQLYRYASLLWSVPVSQGFGRRKRFLVRDKQNRKLIGIFALGDPVFNLRCRDQYIGWSAKDRESRLYNVMDVFVLGAIPPYSQMLGGKLVASLAASNEVRHLIERTYHRQQTVIQKQTKPTGLALLTTSSALGKSAIYSRIAIHGEPLYERIGETRGWGHFHLNHGLFQELSNALEESAPGRGALNRFGQGPNWKIRTAREALRMAGLSDKLMRHGVQREVFAINVSYNARAFLTGEHTRLRRRDLPQRQLVEYWKERWMRGRIIRRPEFSQWSAKEIPTLVRTGTDLKPPPFNRAASKGHKT